MSVFDNVNPMDPAATTASRTEEELYRLEVRKQELLKRKAEDDAAREAVAPLVRKLAIAWHSQLCPNDHATLKCTWYAEGKLPDDEHAADWTDVAHRRWVWIVAGGVVVMRELGVTVTFPEEK